MSFCMAGIDHRCAPLAIRERFFLSRSRAAALAQDIIARRKAQGIFVLSTCARTEIYAQGASEESLRMVLADMGRGEEHFLQFRYGAEAAAHLFMVAAGADSPVFGDADIVRQIKDSYSLAQEEETITNFLSRILERALCVGRDIRSALQFTQRDGNVAARAIELAIENHGRLQEKNVYVIGSGVVGQSLTAELGQQQAQVRIVSNRNHERAALVAKEHGCQAVCFDEFYYGLSRADLIFSATASPHYVVRADLFERAVPSGKSLVIFDLAVPRDIDEKIAGFPGVKIYTIDDIGAPGTATFVEQARQIAQRKAGEFFSREKIYAA